MQYSNLTYLDIRYTWIHVVKFSSKLYVEVLYMDGVALSIFNNNILFGLVLIRKISLLY